MLTTHGNTDAFPETRVEGDLKELGGGGGRFKGPGIELGSPWHGAPTLIRRSLGIRLPSATSLDLVFSALLRLPQHFSGPKPCKENILYEFAGGGGKSFSPLEFFK